MTIKIFWVILYLGFLGCNNMNFEDKAVINGNIESNRNGKIFLVDIAKKDIIKDSTRVINGHFNFTYKSASSFLPFEAMLLMRNEYKGIKYLKPLGFVNPYIKKNIESIFYVDRGITYVDDKINVHNNHFYQIKGSKQNEPYYKHLEFGDLNKNQRAAERKRVIADDMSLITKYPYSFYLLNMLRINRKQYTSGELKLLMEGFTDDAKALLPYIKLKEWILYKQKDKTCIADIVLKNEKSVKKHVFDSTATINMLVFWASWCGPCRKEIPELKEIYLKYHAKGLSTTSISIDNNEKSWQTALVFENMPWKQLITNDSAKNAFDLEYDIATIPIVVLINQKGEVIKRFSGLLPKEDYYNSLDVLNTR